MRRSPTFTTLWPLAQIEQSPAALDHAVDLCYRPRPFENDLRRVEKLSAIYEKLGAPLLPASKKGRPKTRPSQDTAET